MRKSFIRHLQERHGITVSFFNKIIFSWNIIILIIFSGIFMGFKYRGRI